MDQNSQPKRHETRTVGPWDELLGILEEDTNAPPDLIEALRTAHVELEMQAEELRSTQRQMSNALSTFSALFQLLPVPLWILNADATVAHVNMGASRQFPTLKTGSLLTHAMPVRDDRIRLTQALGSLNLERVAVVSSVGLLSESGIESRRGNLHLRRVPGESGTGVFVVAFVDLTTELEREAALDVALSKAQDAALAKSDFLSSVSHELRTPLNAIVGFSRLLENHFAGRSRIDDEKGLHWASTLVNASRHLAGLVSDLLDLQALETGRTVVECVPVDLQVIVQDAMMLVSHKFSHHGVYVRAQACTGPAPVMADPVRCRQVVVNLLDNAAKYTPRGRNVTLTLEARNFGFELAVRDEGPGLTKYQQSQLFTAFNRLGAERSGIEGLGMGLAISKQLVQRMGGRIDCVSAPGQGSTFKVWLPAPNCVPETLLAGGASTPSIQV